MFEQLWSEVDAAGFEPRFRLLTTRLSATMLFPQVAMCSSTGVFSPSDQLEFCLELES